MKNKSFTVQSHRKCLNIIKTTISTPFPPLDLSFKRVCTFNFNSEVNNPQVIFFDDSDIQGRDDEYS